MTARQLAKSPEMKELSRMVRDGELDRARTLNYLNRQGKGNKA